MIAEDLKAFAPLVELSEEERHELVDRLEARPFVAGDLLFSEGDESDCWVLVARGALELSSRRSAATARLEAGEAMGALALLTVGTREVTARALEDGELWLLRRAEFVRLADDSPRAGLRIVSALGAEVALLARRALASAPAASLDPAAADE